MKLKCFGACTKAIFQVSKAEITGIINDFIETLDSIEKDSSLLQQFYDYIAMKFNIRCETGMLLVEKMTTKGLFNRFRQLTDDTNVLANDKMNLYNWIAPKHLEIKDLNISSVISTLKKVPQTELPSVKMYYLMDSIKKLYDKIGTNRGLDDLMPYLVYCFIKANVKDMYLHLNYITILRRRYAGVCDADCMHGFEVPVECTCLVSKDWGTEADYYLTTSIAVVDYIAKLEFYNLKIDRGEFDKMVSRKCKR